MQTKEKTREHRVQKSHGLYVLLPLYTFFNPFYTFQRDFLRPCKHTVWFSKSSNDVFKLNTKQTHGVLEYNAEHVHMRLSFLNNAILNLKTNYLQNSWANFYLLKKFQKCMHTLYIFHQVRMLSLQLSMRLVVQHNVVRLCKTISQMLTNNNN